MEQKIYGGYWRRFGAYLIDNLLLGMCVSIVYCMICGLPNYAVMTFSTADDQWKVGYQLWFAITASIIYALMDWKYGCTLGKRAVGVRVKNINLEAATFTQCFTRNVYKALLSGLGVFSSYSVIINLRLGWYPSLIPLAYSIVFLVFLIVDVNTKKQGFHNRLAGTVIVLKKALDEETENTAWNTEEEPVIKGSAPIPPQALFNEQTVLREAGRPEKTSNSASTGVVKKESEVSENLQLYCLEGVHAGESWDLDSTLQFGRDAEKCNIVFPGNIPGVSRKHCSIIVGYEGIVLVDNGASYGTKVNDSVKLDNHKKVTLKKGDQFVLGKTEKFAILAK